MNWWLVFQLYQWLTPMSTTPSGYLMSSEVFLSQQINQQPILLTNPDTLLLDTALFQATNEARKQAGLSPLQYDRSLQQAAQTHAQSMIGHNYYGHENYYSLVELTPMKRIENQTNQFERIAENIGQYQTIDTPEWFSVRLNKRTNRYEYLNAETGQLYQPYTYASYARYAVNQWLHSVHHRTNLLNPQYTHVGCAARLSPDPGMERRAPFGRLVQNFGTRYQSTQAIR